MFGTSPESKIKVGVVGVGVLGRYHTKIYSESKNADLVVANDVTKEGAGFDADTNIAVLVTAAGARPLPCMAKSALADVILDTLAAL